MPPEIILQEYCNENNLIINISVEYNEFNRNLIFRNNLKYFKVRQNLFIHVFCHGLQLKNRD